MMESNEETIRESCRKDFGACWELAGNQEISLQLFLWLKENYYNLCLIQRWGNDEVETEFEWSLEDDAGYRAAYLEEALWSNPLMPEDELTDEADLADDTQHLEAIVRNPSCPKSVLEEISGIQFDDREWVDEVSEEDVDDLRELAAELIVKRNFSQGT